MSIINDEHQPVDLDELNAVLGAYVEALSRSDDRSHHTHALLPTGAAVVDWFRAHGGEHAAILKMSSELRQARARVEELEKENRLLRRTPEQVAKAQLFERMTSGARPCPSCNRPGFRIGTECPECCYAEKSDV